MNFLLREREVQIRCYPVHHFGSRCGRDVLRILRLLAPAFREQRSEFGSLRVVRAARARVALPHRNRRRQTNCRNLRRDPTQGSREC